MIRNFLQHFFIFFDGFFNLSGLCQSVSLIIKCCRVITGGKTFISLLIIAHPVKTGSLPRRVFKLFGGGLIIFLPKGAQPFLIVVQKETGLHLSAP